MEDKLKTKRVTGIVTCDTTPLSFNHPDAKDVRQRDGCEGKQAVAALLRRAAVSDSAFFSQVDVSTFGGLFHVQYPYGLSAGGRTSRNVSRSSARRKVTARKAHSTRSQDIWNLR